MYKRFVCALALAALVVSGCGSEPETGTAAPPSVSKERVIGIASFTLCCSYFVAMEKAVQAQAAAEGVKVISTNADGKVEKLVSDLQELVTKGVSGIIVSAGPGPAAPMVPALDSLAKAKIPVVLVDRKIKD